MKDYVKIDNQLEKVADASSEALAHHRWHWTLDESNPDRVSITQYARDVARVQTTIRTMVRGYEMWIDVRDHEHLTLRDCITKASQSSDTTAAVEAVAKVTGKALSTVERFDKGEVIAVRDEARDRAEAHGTTIEEEVDTVAEWRAKGRVSREKRDTARKARHSMRFIEVDAALTVVRKALAATLAKAVDVPFDDEERKMMGDSIVKLEGVLALLKLELTGSADIDWDAELAKLT